MFQFQPRLLSGFLIIIGVVSLSFAATTQWRRVQSERSYAELAGQRPENSPVEEPSGEPSDGPAEKVEYVFVDNPNLHWMNINPDYVGWLKLDGTSIDYPLVRSQDNRDYLKLDFYRRRSEAGAIFMDYRNVGHFSDRHTVFYGHHMRNRTMFSQLDAFLSAQFFFDAPLVEVRGLYETKYYRVFSVYSVEADDYVIPVTFDDESYAAYLDSLSNLSLHKSEVLPESELSILSLVTCSDDLRNGRLIVHAIEVRP